MAPAASGGVNGPEPPSDIVFEIWKRDLYQAQAGTQYDSHVWLAFALSSDDPDPINGSWRYDIYLNGTKAFSDMTNAATWQGYPVPESPGWYRVNFTKSAIFPPAVESLTMTANNTAWGPDGREGLPSCAVDITWTVNRSYGQCGSRWLDPPPGAKAAVTSQSGYQQTIAVSWTVSADDPDQANGDFAYKTYREQSFGHRDAVTMVPTTGDGPTTSDGAGNLTRTFERSYTPGEGALEVYAVLAHDNGTLRRSNLSCTATVDASVEHATGPCGTIGRDVPAIAGGSGDDPSFFMVNVPNAAIALGVEGRFVAVLLGLLFSLAFGFFAYRAAGVAGAVFSQTGVVVLFAALDIIPLWVVVVLFMAATAIVVWRSKQ